MLQVGVVGLGSIAAKAYMPVITHRDVEIHLCTRNREKLQQTGKQYRLTQLHENIESLIASGIKAAFVHSSTESHFAIVEQLLLNQIHVFVDKPVTYDYSSTEKLTSLAVSNGLVLQVGFNRRFAPAYAGLKSVIDPSMIIMQKNRVALPGVTRTFVFDDFIHVIDTMLFLFNGPVVKTTVSGKKEGFKLNHVVLQIESASGNTAIGIMNRNGGTFGERLEVFSAQSKWVVNNLVETIVANDKTESKTLTNDWETNLFRRGFDQMVDHFLTSIKNPGKGAEENISAILATHRICEEVVKALD